MSKGTARLVESDGELESFKRMALGDVDSLSINSKPAAAKKFHATQIQNTEQSDYKNVSIRYSL